MAIPKNKVDRAVREDQVHADILAARREKRTQEVRLARLFRQMDRSVGYVYYTCTSIPDYGARFGYSPEEARALAMVGAALQVVPVLEGKLLDGSLTFDAAAVVARIIVHPELGKKADDWIKLAAIDSLAELKRKVRVAIAEAERKEPVTPKTVFLTEQDEKDFFDARGLASNKAGRILSEGETIGVLSRFYLDELDPMRVKPGTRRVPDTRTVGSRYIPREVKRQVWNRTKGRCAVWGCRCRKRGQFAHLFPHSEGGSREADALLLMCPEHHRLFDAGLLIVEGTAENPIFRDVKGNLLPGGPGPPDTG